MKIELQVTSPDTSNVLKCMGVTLKSDYLWWFQPGNKKNKLIEANKIFSGAKNMTHAYTIAELGNMIPWGFFQSSPVHKLPGGIWMFTDMAAQVHHYAYEVEARAHYLVDLIYSKKISVDEVNYPEKYNQPVKAIPQKKKVKKALL